LKVAFMKRYIPADMILASSDQSNFACPSCCRQNFSLLLLNPKCNHAACEECWTSHAEKRAAHWQAHSVLNLTASCLRPNCCEAMAPTLQSYLCTQSYSLDKITQDCAVELARLTNVRGQKLAWGPDPSEAGPECSVCRERRFALLVNPDCDHAVCEDCWAKWFETQLPMCRAQKDTIGLRCVGAGCQASTAAALWAHARSRSSALKAFEKQLAFRRRLLGNTLYPAEVQAECPCEGCLGLGYRGYDTVMCFVCEHQWSPDTTGVSRILDLDSDLLPVELKPGEVMKKCPKCSEHIIKNGGCDHMTCRCGHQFWWTTLLPYRTGPEP